MKKILLAFFAIALAFPAFAQTTQVTNEGNGYTIGTTPQQKVGFHGAQPTAQRSGASENAITLVYATGTLTATANFANGDTVTVGGVTYAFATTLTATANQVALGTSEANSLANLAAAIDAGAGAGTVYGTGTVANPNVTATSTSTTVVVTAIAPGTAGNSIASTKSTSAASWGGSTLSGGAQPDPAAEGVLLNELRAALVQKGLIKGGA